MLGSFRSWPCNKMEYGVEFERPPLGHIRVLYFKFFVCIPGSGKVSSTTWSIGLKYNSQCCRFLHHPGNRASLDSFEQLWVDHRRILTAPSVKRSIVTGFYPLLGLMYSVIIVARTIF